MGGLLVADSVGLSRMVGTPVHLLGVLRAVLSDAAFAMVVGMLLAGRWVDAAFSSSEPVFPVARRRIVLLICVVALILADAVHPWFLAASMTGSDGFLVNLRIVPTILSSTHQGTLWYVNSFALVVLFAVILFRRLGERRLGFVAMIACVGLIAFVKAASGHAADEGDFTLMEFCQWMHILSTAVWSGAILVSGFLIVPRVVRSASVGALWSYAGSLSKSVTWALGVLLVSGIYTSDRELNNSLAALRTSVWGKILVIKLIFVAAAIVLGALNRFLCVNRPPTPERSSFLKSLIFTEALVMLCILCLSGLLGSTAPPMSDM